MFYFEIEVSQTQGQNKSQNHVHYLFEINLMPIILVSLSSEMDCSMVAACCSRLLSVSQASVSQSESSEYVTTTKADSVSKGTLGGGLLLLFFLFHGKTADSIALVDFF